MTEPEPVEGLELDAEPAAAELEEPREYGAEIVGSYLRWYRCTVCGNADTLAIPEYGSTAQCGTCRMVSVGMVGESGREALRGAYAPVVGYPRGTYVPPVAVVVPHPAPVGTSRDEMPTGIVVPGPVLKLAQRARESGWQVLVQYADGHGIHGITGRPTARRQSFAVRMQCGSRRAVAVYKMGSTAVWDGIWIFGDRAPFGHAGVTELEQYLAAGGDVLPSWFAEIVQRRDTAEERKKLKAACDRGQHASSVVNGENFCSNCEQTWGFKKVAPRKEKKSKEGAS